MKKIKMLLASIYYTIYFLLKNVFSINYKKNKNKIPIVVSLTTYSKRINTVFLTIESIFSQSLSPQKIILWLSKDEYQLIPKSLKRLQTRGLEIRICDENIRSYKKLSYASEFFDTSIIVTADDDILYPKHWLKDLYTHSLMFDNTIICHRGHDIIISKNKIESYSSFMNNKIYSDTPSFLLIPTGCSGVLYPIGSLTIEASYKNSPIFMKIAPDADDFWYKCVCLKNNMPAKRVKPVNTHFPPILTSLSDGLFHKNVRNNENDKKLLSSINYFDLYNMIINNSTQKK
ncbi:MAG: hypothetical protein KA277_07040 [Fusobacteriaceae bacterium]|nr:hypothetical protein [Fusobacteriaceae bacterium]